MSAVDVLSVIAVLLILAYPLLYWAFKRTGNVTLLILSSYGLPAIVVVLLAGLLLPFWVLLVHMGGQLDEFGYLVHLRSLLAAGEFLYRYSFVLELLLLLVTPSLLYRRYVKGPEAGPERA
jgi:hypothetical protein